MLDADVGFTAEYNDLFSDTAFGGNPVYYNQGGMKYRFYQRLIPNSPYCDIVSVYGYGGMLDNGIIDIDLFDNWCKDNHIVSEFVRLHPFVENHKLCDQWGGHVVRSGSVAYIDLTQTEDQIWHGFDKGCRSAIKKAKGKVAFSREGVTNGFLALYTNTMDRREASGNYYFAPDFWRKLEVMHPVTYFTSESAALFWFYGDYATYFLSATVLPNFGSMNLILWTAIKEAKSRGCKIFNLGGGLHDGDSLSSFKRSFTKTTKPFYTYRKIHNPKVYEELCRAKGIEADSDGFFPAYRR